jgi:hypothetical protein
MQKFWWVHKENTSKIHWMGWEKMGFSKSQGGLGFRDLTIFNQALLTKQIWRLLQNPTSLITLIYQAKYFPTGSIMEAALGRNPSYAWRSMRSARSMVLKGLVWHIANRCDIRIWGDR